MTEHAVNTNLAVVPTGSELARALLRARKAVSATVYKSNHNKDQGYAYVGHEQVLVSGARNALLAEDLVLEQRHVEYLGELAYATRNGPRPVWRWVGHYALVHGSGEERMYRYEATTQANDKAAFVASTALDRVAHMRVLQIAGSNDENPEHDYHDDRARYEQPAPMATVHTLPAPGGAPPPEPRVDPAFEEKQEVYRRYIGLLSGRKTREDLVGWLRLIVADKVVVSDANLKTELWLAWAAEVRRNQVGNPQVITAEVTSPKKGGK